MRVLSLFDGIAGAAQALKELNIDCEYYACEIDRWAIKIARNNHFDINHLGSSYCGLDVKDFLCDEWEATTKEIQDIGGYTKHKEFIGNTDLLIGGSPCQDLSVAKRGGKGLDGNKSGLFFEYLRILNKVKPKYFILENVASMKAIDREKISKYLFDIEPIKICSSLLTAQMRKRLYWVGSLQEDGSYKKVDIQQPEDKGIVLKDIIESGDTERLKSYCITATYSRACPEDYFNHGQRQLVWKDKSYCIPATYYKENVKSLLKRKKEGLFISLKDMVRKLTPIECERLQGFSDEYSEGVSQTQRYKALGNSFTVPVIKHILKSVLTHER
jgi:DNA-cytosine methyltransferase